MRNAAYSFHGAAAYIKKEVKWVLCTCTAEHGHTRNTSSFCTVMQAALRQFINEVMIKTGAVAAAGFPIITCKVYAVSNVTKWPAGNKALYRHFTNGSLLLTQAADVGSSLLHALLESQDTSWAGGRGEWMACWKRVGKPLCISPRGVLVAAA